jgi:hypothetical protein
MGEIRVAGSYSKPGLTYSGAGDTVTTLASGSSGPFDMRSPLDLLFGRVGGYSKLEIARRTVPCRKYVFEPGESSPKLRVCLLVDSKYLYLLADENLKGVEALEAKARYLKGEMAPLRLREFQPGYCRYDQPSKSDSESSDGYVEVWLDRDLLYDVARANLTDQLAVLSASDTKLGIMAGSGTALLALVAAVFAAAPGHVSLGSGLLLGVTSLPYLYLLVNSFSGLGARDWDFGPHVDLVMDRYRDGHPDAVKMAVIRTLRDACDQNDIKAKAKEKALRHCGLALAVTAVLVLVTLAAFAFSAST